MAALDIIAAKPFYRREPLPVALSGLQCYCLLPHKVPLGRSGPILLLLFFAEPRQPAPAIGYPAEILRATDLEEFSELVNNFLSEDLASRAVVLARDVLLVDDLPEFISRQAQLPAGLLRL
jgi:hypothetical protein